MPTFGLRIDDVSRGKRLSPTLQYPRLAAAMEAFEKAEVELAARGTITEYDGSRVVRIVCVGRREGGEVVWDRPDTLWDSVG